MNNEEKRIIADLGALSNPLENKKIEQKQSDKKSDEKKSQAQEFSPVFIDSLLAYALEVKSSTSFFYGSKFAGKFRSQRKEQALIELIDSLKAAKTHNQSIDPLQILRLIIHHAMLVRGAKKSDAETSSGRSAVALLQKTQFKILKTLLEEKVSDLTYKNLQIFLQINHHEERHPIPAQPKNESKAPQLNPILLKIIKDSNDEKKPLLFTKKDISIIKKHNFPYQIVFYNPILNQFQYLQLAKNCELHLLLDKFKIGDLIIDTDIRLTIFKMCARIGGATPFRQFQLLNTFQNIIYSINKLRPDLVKLYQLPQTLSEDEMHGLCYGLSIAAVNSNHTFLEILVFACSLEKSAFDELLKNGVISGFEKYTLEDILFAYKKISNWHSVENLGIRQTNQYRTSLNYQWVNTLSFSDLSINIDIILQKILVNSNIWEVGFTFPSNAKHIIHIRQDEHKNFSYYDSNKSIIDWHGPFKTVEDLALRISKFYNRHAGEWIVSANALQPIIAENKFDAHVSQLDSVFKKFPESWINYSIKQYLTDNICQTTFAHRVISLLQNLDPRILLQLSAKQLETIGSATIFFHDFNVKFTSSSQLITSDIEHFNARKNKKNLLHSLINFGDINAVLDLLKLDDHLFATAVKRAIEVNNLALIAEILQHKPQLLKSASNTIFLQFFYITNHAEVAGLLLRALGIHAKTETDIWGHVAFFAAQHKDFDLLNKLNFSAFTDGIKIIDKSDFSSEKKQQLRARIEQAFFHRLDERYPLTPPAWSSSFTSSTTTFPSKASIISNLSTLKKQDNAELLTLLGYGDKASTLTYQGS